MGKGGDKFIMGVVAGVVGLVLLCVCCIVAGPAALFGSLFSSDVHKTAKEFLQNSPAVTAELGPVQKVSQKIQGSLHEDNGAGDAELFFDVTGANASGVAKVRLTKAKGKEWVVGRAELDVAGRIVVLKE